MKGDELVRYRRSGGIGTGIRIVETGEVFETACDCARRLKRCESAVSLCINGINSTCAGYHLELADINISDHVPYEIFEGRTVEIEYAPGYFVSELGIVYGPGSMGHRAYHKMHQYAVDDYGHQVVDLYINGKRKHKHVAVLVAEAFIPNPNNYPEVCHDDGNPYNNHVTNLKWGTHVENMRDSIRHGTFHYFTPEEDEMALQVLRKQVKAINIDTGEVQMFCSLSEAARELGLFESNISKVLCGVYRRTGRYTFEYIDKEEYYAQTD